MKVAASPDKYYFVSERGHVCVCVCKHAARVIKREKKTCILTYIFLLLAIVILFFFFKENIYRK